MISFLLFHQPAWHNRGSKRPLLLQARQRAGSLIPALGPSFWRDQIQGHRHGHKFQGQQWDTAEQPLGDRHLDLARRGPACTPCSLRAKLSRLRKGNPVWSQSAIFFFFFFPRFDPGFIPVLFKSYFWANLYSNTFLSSLYWSTVRKLTQMEHKLCSKGIYF